MRRTLLLLAIIGVVSAVWILRVHESSDRQAYACLADLACPDPARRLEAETVIRRLGTNAVPVIITALRGRDSKFKRKVLNLLKEEVFEGESRYSVDRFSSDARFDGALRACSILGPLATPTVPMLVDVVQENKGGNIASNSVTSAPMDLLLIAINRSTRLCYSAIEALGSIGKISDSVIPVLISNLDHRSPHVRMKAAWALGQLKSPANDAIPALIERLNDPNTEVREQAAIALHRIGAKR